MNAVDQPLAAAPVIDPVTFAVIKNAMDAIVDEVAYTVLRTARSEIVKDVMDYSAAICDREGRMIAQAKTIALHLGAIPEAMEAVKRRYGSDLRPGDAVILNDPYEGGMHLPDIFMFVPFFYRDEIEGYCVVICHHTDVGGRVPGSNASDSTEIYQEGIRIPVVKLYEAGQVNDVMERLIARNVRVPDRVLGDLRAQYAAAKVGVRELTALFDRYGREGSRAYFAELLDYAERLTREEIRSWPKGTYHFLDHIDDDGLSPEPIPIQVALTVHEDYVSVDYTGTSEQVRAAINSTLSYTKSCTYLSVRCALKGDVPNNAGVFRCVEIHAPAGSVLNPREPAAVAARALTGYRVFDAMLGALAQVVPDRIPAAGEGGNTVVCLSGKNDDHKPYIIVDMICGAWGARPDSDGIEAITNASQNLSNTPVEVLEAQHPVRVEAYELEPDSCGAGRFRGGLGIRRSYRVLADNVLLQLRADRMKFRPYGLAGGTAARAAVNRLDRVGEPPSLLPSKVSMTIGRGDMVTHIQPGGGGFGDAALRDPAAIVRDVWNGKLSAGYVREHYGMAADVESDIMERIASGALAAVSR
ncbi:Acetone carboxylase alpha subunit [Achromobacter denitrificans]|uniref:hydantoinase B/oxoprolinase family protein n=1 Tax=Achromobacter denitrificans TaxID=32002 RepID=UPI000788D18E|nr:hydantoinase B/oxoprolinase family protein [Achromobacter denitrificans]OLU00289.1 5-oxoprolinase [Achromobacter denitrificans]QKH42266.1 hydantoinase B/oxoprolinase family protein [Achromobacter denitrificans]QKH50590.1 hydantoinase B/oxoprolinase family protein [Achromobacter denitrificans]CAB3744174.1 Acetophenone carboxylase delta subunit [Achromobacter denitrificans]SUU22027.1 Acetone carboxylase alpha subunit [Achromobacter denitrificans]